MTIVFTNHLQLLTERRQRQELAVIAAARRIVKSMPQPPQAWMLEALQSRVASLNITVLQIRSLRRKRGEGLRKGLPP